MSTPAHLSPQAKTNAPAHVAIIMDGNGRWARQRHLPRVEGHRQLMEQPFARLQQGIERHWLGRHTGERAFVGEPDVLSRRKQAS